MHDQGPLQSKADPFEGNVRAVISLVLVTTYAWLSFIFLPLMVDTYVRAYHLSDQFAGLLSGVELGSVTIFALLSAVTVHRRDKRLLCQIGSVIVILGNVASVTSSSWEILGLSRLVVGAGLGLVVSATNALPALSDRSERLYALGQFAVCALGSALIFIVPPIVDRTGYQGIFYLEIAISVVAVVFTIGLPKGVVVRETRSEGRVTVAPSVIGALSAAFIFYVVQTALWGFAGQAGARVGLDPRAIDFYLGASAVCGVAGALTAIVLDTKLGLLWPLILGFVSQALFGVLLYSAVDRPSFVTAVLLITVSSVFTTPYLLAVAARLDGLGRIASAAGAVMNFGATGGPMLAGFTAARFGYGWIGYGSALLLMLGLVLIIGAARLVNPRSTMASAS